MAHSPCCHTRSETERWPQAHTTASSRTLGQQGDRRHHVDLHEDAHRDAKSKRCRVKVATAATKIGGAPCCTLAENQPRTSEEKTRANKQATAVSQPALQQGNRTCSLAISIQLTQAEAAISIRFSMSSCKRQLYYARSRGAKQLCRSYCNAICRDRVGRHNGTTCNAVGNCSSKTGYLDAKAKNKMKPTNPNAHT